MGRTYSSKSLRFYETDVLLFLLKNGKSPRLLHIGTESLDTNMTISS